ncbi:hypothetical protein OSCI_860004 [Kamptonema sp. PCC 6506]|nr:hypothetical protein OSCI_860004 [Kamptonema sp. PCC 6506]
MPLSIIFVMSITVYGWVGFLQVTKPTVRLSVEPPLSQIVSFEQKLPRLSHQ